MEATITHGRGTVCIVVDRLDAFEIAKWLVQCDKMAGLAERIHHEALRAVEDLKGKSTEPKEPS